MCVHFRVALLLTHRRGYAGWRQRAEHWHLKSTFPSDLVKMSAQLSDDWMQVRCTRHSTMVLWMVWNFIYIYIFFLNPDLYSAAHTSWYRGGHIKLCTMLGQFVVEV